MVCASKSVCVVFTHPITVVRDTAMPRHICGRRIRSCAQTDKVATCKVSKVEVYDHVCPWETVTEVTVQHSLSASCARHNVQNTPPAICVLKQCLDKMQHLLALKPTCLQPARLPSVLNLYQAHIHQLQQFLHTEHQVKDRSSFKLTTGVQATESSPL